MSKRKKILRFLKTPLLIVILLIPMFFYDGGVSEVEAYCSGNKCSKCNGNGYYTTTTTYSGGKMVTRFGCERCGGSGNKIYYYNSSGTQTSTSGSYTAGSGGDHNWSEGNHTNRCTEPTCTTTGCWHYTCTYCGARGATHHNDVPALGHNYVNAGDVIQWTSCTNDGYRQYSCSRCGGQDGQWHLYEYAWGHAWGDWYENSAYPGYWVRSCTRGCGSGEMGDAIKYTVTFDGNTDDETLELVPDAITGNTVTGITLPSYSPIRKGYAFDYWGPSKSDLYGVSNGRFVKVNGSIIDSYWICQLNTSTFEILININNNMGVNYVYVATTQTGSDTVWYEFGKSSWVRSGHSFNYGGQIKIDDHGSNMAKSFITRIYAQSGQYAGNGVLSTWNTDYYDISVYPGNTYKAAGNSTLYAHWSANKYKVALDANGGKVDKSDIEVTYDSSYKDLPTPKREGFTFKGWYYGDTKVTSETTANLEAQDHILVASWERNKYNVTYHAEGGKFEDGTSEKSVETYFEHEVDLGVVPTKLGRIFLGWSESSDGTAFLTNKIMPSKDIDLYAIYTLPVSDIKEVNLVSWSKLDTSIVNIMPMSMVGEEENGYYYSINNVNTLKGLTYNDLNDISLYILIYDNAGNRTDIPIQLGDAEVPDDEDIPVPKKYLQTTLHYVWDLESEKWLYITTTDELVEEGEIYTPKFLTETEDKYPKGYKPDSIDAKYIVKGEKTTNAYYKPVSYKLYFEPNGGECDTEYKVVYKDYYIGVLPTAERDGYDFLGWYTEIDGGTQISDSDKYSYDSDITVYAHWEVHKHDIMFDYSTNGGSGVNEEYWEDIEYGKEIVLDNQAYKENGWDFVGWSTDPDSKEGIDSLVMPDNDVILYAIYSKEVGVTFIDFQNDERVQREETGTIYNNEEYLEITIPEQNTKDGWKCMGWTEDGETEIGYSSNTQIQVSDWKTLFGCYEKEVTVSFDTNGSLEEIEDITAKRSFISSGEEIIPTITVPKGPSLEEHSFVVWVDKDGNEYEPGEELKVPDDITLIATWDKFPEIEAYDRYFSLSFAQSGGITENVLFEKVTATDEEDGTLENGTGVTIVGYQASDFTSFEDDGSVSVTYAATDSFGNRVTVMVVVYIVDTASTEPLYNTYIRFIDQKYYMDADGNYVPTTAGGLESTSRWITDAAYAGTLTNVLANKKDNIEKTIFNSYGKEIEMPNLASGEWSHVKSQWRLSKSAIDEVREYVKTNGYGKFKDKNAIANFYTEFGEHRNY